MNNPLKSDPAKQGRNLAGQIAKQIVKEPFEIAKGALNQVAGLETSNNSREPKDLPNENQNKPLENEQLLEQQKAQGKRQLEALENEMEEIIEKEKVKKQQQKVIQNQDEILEKKDKESSPLIIPTSKKTRNIFAGLRRKPKQNTLQAERQRTRVERVMPPAG
ncbi:hypothetical protein KJ570_03645 [Patescibacteria group bacterium]|nr:hypothetical protein [Patescibacteria group bacterium]